MLVDDSAVTCRYKPLHTVTYRYIPLLLDDSAVSSLRYASEIRDGRVLLLPQLAKRVAGRVSYNEVQLRAVSKARCFLAPQASIAPSVLVECCRQVWFSP